MAAGSDTATPRPRATRLHRQAQHAVLSPAMPTAAASDQPLIMPMASRNGPAPSRQNSAARIAAPPVARAALHHIRLIGAPFEPAYGRGGSPVHQGIASRSLWGPVQ